MTENENIQIAIGNLTAIKLICKKFENAEETIDLAIKALEKVQQFESTGTIEEFKALKEKNETLKALYENARKEGNNLIIKARAEAANEFANYLHEKAKENNGLRLSSETRSWTHPCIFDYLEEFKNEQICKEET